MRSLFKRIFVHNWQRKCIAIFVAAIIWLLVNHSITITHTFNNIPVKIVNLPQGKTIEGLLPNGFLENRISLTLTGKKQTIEELQPGDIEVIIDAANKGNEWIVKINKQMLHSTNPEIDLPHNITEISHGEFVLKLSRLIIDKIPISITRPVGEPPMGYQFLDVWPQTLYQTVSGPEEQINSLRNSGLELTLDLSDITKQELDNLFTVNAAGQRDEVSFLVPKNWKKVGISFEGNTFQEINDPAAEQLRIDFLRKELLAIDAPIPVTVFFPLRYSPVLNPANYTLEENDILQVKNGISLLVLPVYVRNVSRLFLDVVRDHLEVTIIASPTSEREEMEWSVQFIDPQELENAYVAVTKTDLFDKQLKEQDSSLRENYLRSRFRSYMRKMELYTADDKKLQLEIQIAGHKIVVKNVSH
ncbi:MAG: hypothetical protein JHC93_04435 [Parachlamydiales bacterium]|nr:hypothetical protein [Parachlamydiales bacterium]